MSRAPLIRQTKPEDLRCKVAPEPHRPGARENQFTVENNHKAIQDWDREYVSFGGFFGTHGPHVFAAAPELFVDLVAVLEEIDEEIDQRKHSGNDEDYAALQALSDRAHVTLRKARGER